MTETSSYNKVSRRILVVEDEVDIGLLMKMFLSSEGFLVEFVQNLVEARAALSNGIFSTVFLDLNLDGEFGLDLVPFIREQNYPVKITVITAQKDPSVIERVKNSKVDHFIEKPFNRKQILAVVHNSGNSTLL